MVYIDCLMLVELKRVNYSRVLSRKALDEPHSNFDTYYFIGHHSYIDRELVINLVSYSLFPLTYSSNQLIIQQ